MQWRELFKILRIPFWGFLVHVILLCSVFEIHFRSPVLNDLEPVENDLRSTPADRLVLFSGDGIRARTFFHTENGTTPVDFLRCALIILKFLLIKCVFIYNIFAMDFVYLCSHGLKVNWRLQNAFWLFTWVIWSNLTMNLLFSLEIVLLFFGAVVCIFENKLKHIKFLLDWHIILVMFSSNVYQITANK